MKGGHKRPSSSTLWTRENLAWVAGLLEGEGSFLSGKVSPSRNPTGRLIRLEVCCTMTDLDVLSKLHVLSGMGSIYGPYLNSRHSHGHKEVWRWHVQSGRDAYALCIALLPYMGERRSAKIRSGIREWLNA